MVQSPLADESGIVSGRFKFVRNTVMGWSGFTGLVLDRQEHRDDTATYPVEPPDWQHC